MGSEGEYLLLEELKLGDVIIGSHINPNWDLEYTVTQLPIGPSRVILTISNRGREESLMGLSGYRFRVKERLFQYNPNQCGDTDDDI